MSEDIIYYLCRSCGFDFFKPAEIKLPICPSCGSDDLEEIHDGWSTLQDDPWS